MANTSSGTNARAARVRRWVERLPPDTECCLSTRDGDEWVAVAVYPPSLSGDQVGSEVDDALADIADETGRQVTARLSATVDGRDLTLGLRAAPTADAGAGGSALVDPSELDGSTRGAAAQAQRHAEVLVRLSLQERHAYQQQVSTLLELQQQLALRAIERAERAEDEVATLREVLSEMATPDESGESEGQESPIMAMLMQVAAKRLAATARPRQTGPDAPTAGDDTGAGADADE